MTSLVPAIQEAKSRRGRRSCSTKLTDQDAVQIPLISNSPVDRACPEIAVKFSCDKCSFTCSKPRSFSNHARKHDPTAYYAYKSRLRNMPKQIYPCTLCLKVFQSKCNLAVHIRRHLGEKPFSCAQCSKSFTTNGHLQRHIEGVHSDEKDITKFKCQECSKAFPTSEKLKTHARIRHAKVKKFECGFCNKRFYTKGELLCHIPMHTREKTEKCKNCNKSFPRKGGLNQHVKRMHSSAEEGRAHACYLCSNKFKTASDLRRHLETHMVDRERPHECRLCGKKFLRKENLGAHIQIHVGEKQFSCKFCSMEFRLRNDWERHEERHFLFGERQVKCDMCDKSFLHPIKLANHRNEEHGIALELKRLQCEDCNKFFSSQFNLNRHRRNQHTKRQQSTA